MSTGWVFVDVETTGLNAAWDRVVSVSASAHDADGRLVGELHTLVDPQRDPGPVHIHGLTSRKLAGAPLFDEVAGPLAELAHGRVLVAHNAQFDHKFLQAETQRSSVRLPTTHRLCTIALAKRLDLPLANHKLATVASYWGVRQHAPHDARDDVRVLREIFWRSEALARMLDVELPVLSCTGRGAASFPARIPRVPSPWANPRQWTPPARLVQGMKVVITGETAKPRQTWARELSQLGFDVMNSVSGQTRLLVCNDLTSTTVKLSKAHSLGVPVLSEHEFTSLLDDIEPGTVRGAGKATRKATVNAPAGPWSGRSVLVLGGSAQEAALARERAAELGARVLVSLGARTTHVLCLTGAEKDRRHAKIAERGLVRLVMGDLGGTDGMSVPPEVETTTEVVEVVQLCRGQVIDLAHDSSRFALSANWQPPAPGGPGWEVDVVAFVLGTDGRVATDDDFVFYNQPSTPDGGVRLSVDGSCEQGVELDLEALPEHATRIRVAAAIDGSATFGDVGAIRLSLAEADSGQEIASTTLDAATEERTLVLADIYQRGGAWRFRAVGQGHDLDLGELAGSLGVEVD